MSNIIFNGFSFQDSNWITERVTFKNYASREVIRAKISRREGVSVLASEFGEKQITIEGRVVGDNATDLQSLLDSMKTAATAEEGVLSVEDNRNYVATVTAMSIPDEHYNNSTTKFSVTFTCSNPYAEDLSHIISQTVTSGIFTISGMISISGSIFARPVLTYTPPSNTGHTLLTRLDILHIQTGTTVTISGFGAGTDLGYQNPVSVDYDQFLSFEGNNAINNSGAFARWQPGENDFVITSSGRAFPGGTLQTSYKPRWL